MLAGMDSEKMPFRSPFFIRAESWLKPSLLPGEDGFELVVEEAGDEGYDLNKTYNDTLEGRKSKPQFQINFSSK